MNTEMKFSYMLTTQEQRLHRSQEKVCNRKAIKQVSRGRNYPYYEEQAKEHRSSRMMLRLTQRYLHLARGFVSERDYKSIENATKDGNEPDLTLLLSTLNVYGYEPNPSTVERWLK